VLPEPDVASLAAAMEAASGDAHVTVDLERSVVVAPSGEEHAFAIDPARREALLAGLDDIGQTLRQAEAITAWQTADRSTRPWVWASAQT